MEKCTISRDILVPVLFSEAKECYVGWNVLQTLLPQCAILEFLQHTVRSHLRNISLRLETKSHSFGTKPRFSSEYLRVTLPYAE